jgi:hypothetical protein
MWRHGVRRGGRRTGPGRQGDRRNSQCRIVATSGERDGAPAAGRRKMSLAASRVFDSQQVPDVARVVRPASSEGGRTRSRPASPARRRGSSAAGRSR